MKCFYLAVKYLKNMGTYVTKKKENEECFLHSALYYVGKTDLTSFNGYQGQPCKENREEGEMTQDDRSVYGGGAP